MLGDRGSPEAFGEEPLQDASGSGMAEGAQGQKDFGVADSMRPAPRSKPLEGLQPAPPSEDAPDPEVLALIGNWIGMQRDLKVARRHPRDKVADAITAQPITYEKVVLADSSTFEGQLRGDDRHGWGKFTWDDGGAYEGQFDGNDMHGQGTYRWADGSVYTGVWTRNQMGPNGTMTWTDGRKYLGEFVDGRKHGEGRILWPDGRAYAGQWALGKQHGFGVTVHSTGRERMSQWQNGTLVRWIEDSAEFDSGKAEVDESRRRQSPAAE